jgi:hypothetical protein
MRTLVGSAAVLVLAVVLLVLPVEIPYATLVPGKVLAAREWMVIRDRDGNVATMLRDHVAGRVDQYALNRFERGDAVRFVVHPGYRPQAAVARGDTVGSIFSSDSERQLAELSGSFSSALAELDLYTTGEKASVVAEAGMRLARAEEQSRQHARVLERLRSLRDRDLISAQDLEVAESQRELYDADIEIARARLEAVTTGAKPEQIALTRTEAEALQRRIEVLNRRLELYTLISPLSGVATRSLGSDTLVAVRDTSEFVVLMPIRLQHARHVVPGQEVTVRIHGFGGRMRGRIAQVGDEIYIIDGEQVLLVTAHLDERLPGLLPGALAECRVLHDVVSPSAYVRLLAQSLFN